MIYAGCGYNYVTIQFRAVKCIGVRGGKVWGTSYVIANFRVGTLTLNIDEL